MRQFWIHLKTEVRAILKQWPQVIGTYLLIPLFFALFMGFSFDPAFTPEVSIEPISVSLRNEDQGPAGQQLVDVMKSEEMSEIFELVEMDDADFHLQIAEDYSEQLEDTLITIETEPNVSSKDSTILSQFIQEWQQTLVDQRQLASELEAVENPESIQNLVASLEEAVALNREDTIQTVAYDSDTALTSNQFTAISGFLYLLFMSLSSSVAMQTKKEFTGLKKRIGVLPLTTTQTVLYDILTNTLVFTVLSMFYMGLWRLFDHQTFVGNPFHYLFWILIYTLFFQVLNVGMSKLLSGKWTNIFYQVILMVYMIFGFIPIDRIVGGEIGQLLSENIVRQIFTQPFYDYMLTGQVGENIGVALGLILASLLLTFMTIRLSDRKEMQTA